MQAAALPSAAAIRVGEIVIGRATQYNSGSALRSADGGVHKYLHHLVTGVKPDGALPRAAPARAVDDQDFAAALRKRQTLSLTYVKLLTSTDLRSFPAALYSFFALRVNITLQFTP